MLSGTKEEIAMDYKEKIIEMVESIGNQGILKFIYSFIKTFLEEQKR